jgi:hypothetical protein
MKSVTVISLILLAGLASAYTPEQQTTLDGMNLSFKIGVAYEQAIQGQNITEFNALVDEYNTWIRQHIGEDASLFKLKMNETATIVPNVVSPTDSGTAYLVENPFNASSDLSKFGKKEVYVATGKSGPEMQTEEVQQKDNTF